ncbi:MAG: hypothetical protein KatS3mg002_0145 [Candidatus Woesearchaeota archaeon]|nr:MAG: hypothetical protein KatS3mg002_0145 [Candidatus Woesearchaeota archaeon]
MIIIEDIKKHVNKLNNITKEKIIFDTNIILTPPIIYYDIEKNKYTSISTKHSSTWLRLDYDKINQIKKGLNTYWEEISETIDTITPTIKQELTRGIKITPKIINYIHQIEDNKTQLIKEILKKENQAIKNIIEKTKKTTKEIEDIILENYEKYEKILSINYEIQQEKQIESKNDYKIMTESVILSTTSKKEIILVSYDYDMVKLLIGIKQNINRYIQAGIDYLNITLYSKKNIIEVERKLNIKMNTSTTIQP